MIEQHLEKHVAELRLAGINLLGCAGGHLERDRQDHECGDLATLDHRHDELIVELDILVRGQRFQVILRRLAGYGSVMRGFACFGIAARVIATFSSGGGRSEGGATPMRPTTARAWAEACASGTSEWQDGIGDLLSVAWLLDIGDLPAATVGNARAGNLVICDLVLTRDVRRSDKALHDQFTHLEVDPDLLRALDSKDTIRQRLHHGRSDAKGQLFLSCDTAVALVVGG